MDVDASCPDCTIVLDSVWHSSPGNPDVMDPIRVVEIGDSVLIADHRARHLVLFGPSGETLRIVGEPGVGPGELPSIVGLAQTPDQGTLIVSSADRISIFDETLTFRASFRPSMVVQGTGLIALSDSTLLLAELDRSGASVTHQQVYSFDGRRLASFDTTSSSAGGSPAARTPEGTVWVVATPTRGSVAEFDMVEWDPARQEQLRTLRRTPPWFMDWDPASESVAETPGGESSLRPVLYDVVQPSSDVIWALTLVPDEAGRELGGLNEVGDVILEAIDAASLEVLQAIRLDQVPTGFTPRGSVVIYSESPQGSPSLVLARPRLLGR